MLEKIKKLLRLATDKAASPAEAANAMARAIKMANEAGLNIDQINPDDTETKGGLNHESASISGFGDAEKIALLLIQIQFNVHPFLDHDQNGKRSMVFIGTPDGCQLAAYVFTYLVRVMRKAWKDNSDRRLKRPAFLKGFGMAISEQIPNEFKQPVGNSLVLSGGSYIKKHLLRPGAKIKTTATTPSKGSSEGSLRSGYCAGKKAGIRNGLKGGTLNLETE